MTRQFPRPMRVNGPVGLGQEPPQFDWASFWDFLQKASLLLGLALTIRTLSE